ncbi:MAG: LPS export ABC transporter permease LptF [Oceanococcus sp.]
MSPRILERYLFVEAARTWFAVTAVLMAIMLSTRFARFLGEAAKGTIPPDLLWQVVFLSSLQYLTILTPISLLLGAMLSLGRMYRDSEIAAMQACGVGLGRMHRPFLKLGLMLAALTAVLSLWLSPLAGRTVDFLTKKAAQELQFGILEPGRFRELPDDAGVFYVESVSDDGSEILGVFARLLDEQGESVITAPRGVQRTDTETGRRSIVLLDGYRVDGSPGRADYRVTRFAEHGVSIDPPDFIYRYSKQALKPTLDLWLSQQPEDIAELQWRLSAPLAVILLALLAVPLSKTDARSGRYGKVGLGIVSYIVYFNVLGIAQAWLESGELPPWIGLWWVHLIVALLVLRLYASRGAWVQRMRVQRT